MTAALSLAASGWSVVVAERADALSEIGAGIQITPNAGRILARLGLDKAMAAAALEPEAIDVRNGLSGRLLTSIASQTLRGRYGFPYRVIHRADLQALLVGAVSGTPAIQFRLGTTVESHHEDSDGISVRITRAGNSETINATALIAADGVRSTIRERISGGHAKLAGRTAWRALVAAEDAQRLLRTTHIGLWLGPKAHLVHYPVMKGAAVNIVAIVEDAEDEAGWSVPGDAAEIAARFDTWSDAARGIVARPKTWQKFALAGVDPQSPWISGRIALIGDAAHAMMPFLAQGAAMAIEDAAVLASALRGTNDIAGALRKYEAERKPRVTRVAELSRRTGEVYHFGSTMAALRDAALSVAGARLVLSRSDWIYRWLPPT